MGDAQRISRFSLSQSKKFNKIHQTNPAEEHAG